MADSQDVQDKIVQLMKAIRSRLAELPPGSETTALKASQEHLQEALDELSMDSLSQAATDVAKATNDLQQMVDSAPGQTLPDALQKALDAIGGLGKSTVQPSPPDPKTTTVQRLAPGPQSDTASADPTAKTKVPSAFVSQVVQVATDQWTFFGEQEYEANGNVRTVGHKEGEDPWFKTIGQYWLKGTNTHGLDGQDHASPWSAAFISWVMKEAGAGDRFRYSTQHSVYISQAIRDFSSKRSGAGFWGQRLNEYQPAVGDLVCWSRQDGVDYDHQLGGDYKGHSDIIVAVESARIWIIGGNVGDSVTKRPLPLDARGFLGPISQGGETVFAIMQDRIGSPESDSSDVGPAVAGTKVSQASANEGPDATLQGFDADFDCSQHLSKAKAAGINFIGRYYSNSPGKNLSPSEARLITGAGMFIVPFGKRLGTTLHSFRTNEVQMTRNAPLHRPRPSDSQSTAQSTLPSITTRVLKKSPGELPTTSKASNRG